MSTNADNHLLFCKFCPIKTFRFTPFRSHFWPFLTRFALFCSFIGLGLCLKTVLDFFHVDWQLLFCIKISILLPWYFPRWVGGWLEKVKIEQGSALAGFRLGWAWQYYSCLRINNACFLLLHCSNTNWNANNLTLNVDIETRKWPTILCWIQQYIFKGCRPFYSSP